MEQAQVLRRALLQDRWDAIMYDVAGEDPTDWTDLHADLAAALQAIVAGVARVHPDEVDTDHLMAVIRDEVVDQVSRS